MRPNRVRLPEGRVWLRVAEPEWADPLDASFAGTFGGRWNPPDSFLVLYLNADVATAQLQIERMLAGSPAYPDDLDDDAYVLVATTLPRAQHVADAVTHSGLLALGLPTTYPLDASGGPVGHLPCQEIGAALRERRLRGVWCRSACASDGRGRELAWFPASRRSLARPVWDEPLPLGSWRDATGWAELGLEEQPDPRPVT